MNDRSRAAVYFCGDVMRYAEIDQKDDTLNLCRLGSCDFDFDLITALASASRSECLDIIAGALEEVFDGSQPARVRVVLHPNLCHSFFSPLPPGLPEGARQSRLQEETAFVGSAGQSLSVVAEPLRSEEIEDGHRVEWFHVMALEGHVKEHLDRIASCFGAGDRRFVLGQQSAANVVWRTEESSLSDRLEGPFSLAIGQFDTHTEYVVTRKGRLFYSHFTLHVAPTDCAYFAIATLKRLRIPVDDVAGLYVYGEDPDPDRTLVLSSLLRCASKKLNPIQFVDLDQDEVAVEFDPQVYVPCLGAIL